MESKIIAYDLGSSAWDLGSRIKGPESRFWNQGPVQDLGSRIKGPESRIWNQGLVQDLGSESRVQDLGSESRAGPGSRV